MNDDYSHFVFEDEYDYSQLLCNPPIIHKQKQTKMLTPTPTRQFSRVIQTECTFNDLDLTPEYYYDTELATQVLIKRPKKTVKPDSFRIDVLLDIIPPTITSLATTIWSGILPILSKHRIFQ